MSSSFLQVDRVYLVSSNWGFMMNFHPENNQNQSRNQWIITNRQTHRCESVRYLAEYKMEDIYYYASLKTTENSSYPSNKQWANQIAPRGLSGAKPVY